MVARIMIFLTTAILFLMFSCIKEPTVVEAKESVPGYLAGDGITDVKILDGVDPDCLSEYRYRFAFTGIKNDRIVRGCICWSYPDWMVIHVDSDEPEK